MAAKAKALKRQKPFWERGYKGHVYWMGKEKLGKITLEAAPKRGEPHRYRWEAAGRLGRADTLDNAKSAVELAVAMADRQLDLFNR